jgi:hypothetical protein
MRRLDGQWRTKAHVAHIRGLNRESARFDESVPVPERNSFGNLLLLCKPHHDLVDSKALEKKYPKETLIAWKVAREGEYAGDLLELGAVTEDTLKKWMTEAVIDTRYEIATAFDRLEDVGDALITALRQAVLDFFDLPYLDPEDIRSLQYTATVFERIPDYADALYHSAHDLRHLPDTTDILFGVTSQLKNLPDTADILFYAAEAIKEAGLDEFTRHARNVKSSASELAEASGDLSSATQSIESMMEIVAVIRETSGRLERAASAVRPSSSWSWRAFWWGTAVCAIFVIAVLALGLHVFAGK